MKQMINKMCVGGCFDTSGGRRSGYVDKLCFELNKVDPGWVVYNGGDWNKLMYCLSLVPQMKIVLWMPDIPNEFPKYVNDLKGMNPKMLLVTSKNNRRIEKQYSPQELIARMLATKSNLMLEFGDDSGLIVATIWDALGNVFGYKLHNVNDVAMVLTRRLNELQSYTRVGSRSIGAAKPVPDEKKFFEIGRQYAEVFHDLIHGGGTTRFLGNMSFRCSEGFPSFRKDGLVYVSKRNIDKRKIDKDSFVAVELEGDGVQFYGDTKPSVDTPIQLRLYREIPTARYMLHSHCMIADCPMTDSVIPCGALEEAEEILSVWHRTGGVLDDVWCVNLKGHGSIAIAADVQYLKGIRYVAREIPTFVDLSQQLK